MNLFSQFLEAQMMTSALSAGLRRWKKIAGSKQIVLFAVSDAGSCLLSKDEDIPSERLRRLAEQLLQFADAQDHSEREARANT
ncbi:hypothetical protein YH66_05160 [[Brevibacterium] flavum]|uniref:Uncharacterized protein n=1 Tax=[Brevibacterium] flavum TaxID=92706 RepID=A0A0F6Z4X8_9CORY|nr:MULTISPECIES: hypothetical protein [Corynebacterium]AKF26987.1 hypothetical protein YH66_05160 [[Brevibacterium] flavum]ANE07809.1 hypothetical protein A3654_05150 [Corynebacterium glutamicum]AST20225.1 hypothetical protein CEY17_05215 [Corynebacterium glutamicum ATCC 14067]KEI22699.1 hypothetical protein KIQ_008990 [Corynebacterium glutamicum ATCC 14067]KIH74244.1 hypothetical protein SD36_05185 [Corynebacterium glutamicum]